MTIEKGVLVVTVRAKITLWVGRGATGDLRAGAMTVLKDAGPVVGVDALEVTGFRPTATDIRVDLQATVKLHTPRCDIQSTESALCDGFGIISADINWLTEDNS
ncbi:hypothetical protein [Halocatena halophila]|uniref:hypothetical protein n=1 Tax=Halocatena halophila TaxID=2814576 RepID=UPI002ED3E932